MASVQRAILITLLGLMLPACADFDLQVWEGRRLMAQGDFDGALERFQRASMSRPDNPDQLAALGLLLSLRPVSIPVAVRAMETSLLSKPEDSVRWELLLLYIQLARHQDAARLLGPDRIPIARYFTPEMVTLRAGAACVAEPGARQIAALQKYATGPRGQYFLARCQNAAGLSAQAVQTFSELKDPLLRCRLISDLPELLNRSEPLAAKTPSDPAAKVETKSAAAKVLSPLVECRRRFPGVVHLFRPHDLKLTNRPAVAPRKLFRNDQELPPYPDDPWTFRP